MGVRAPDPRRFRRRYRLRARDAAGTAVELERAGARWLHIVDLDAARGSGDNRALIAAIRGAVGLRLQVGGGVRTLADAADCWTWA